MYRSLILVWFRIGLLWVAVCEFVQCLKYVTDASSGKGSRYKSSPGRDGSALRCILCFDWYEIASAWVGWSLSDTTFLKYTANGSRLL